MGYVQTGGFKLNRRDLLRSLVAGVSLVAAERVWPFRVYSFAPEVTAIPAVIGNYSDFCFINDEISSAAVELGYRAGQSIAALYAEVADGNLYRG